MKDKFMNLVWKMGTLAASLAMVLAIGGTGRNCWFLMHQPEVPEELRQK